MPKTLLLADDSVTIQKVVGISFANEDIVLLTVDNGDDAITRAREARPDIVLADVVMPGKNGYDVCQAIKAEPDMANIPVLLLTGTFEAFDEQRAARVGADGHITKPFEAQALVDKVNALLARPAPGAAPETAGRPEATPIGAMRGARPAPPPQPVSHTADTAYDFFDEEITAPREADETPRDATPRDTTVVLSPPPAESDDPFSLDAPSAAAGAPALLAPAPADSLRGAFGSDELDLGASAAPGADESSLFDDFETPAAEDAPAWSVREASPPVADFGWEAPAEAEPAAEEPAWDAPLAPAARDEVSFDAGPAAQPSGGFDWDLGGDSATATAPARAEVPDWFAPAAPGPDPAATRLLETPAPHPAESFDPAPAARGFGEFELEAGLGESAAFGDAVSDPRGGRDYDVSSSDLGPIFVAPPAPPAPAPSFAAREAAPAASPSPASAASALPERERRELHDALEKLAWEAFGPVAESLVREAVERIERIAWEVIPQLAESLIKEELRKLKGE